MGISRIVNTDFWRDEKVIDHYSPEDKYFWLYLLTNPQTKQLGIYKLPKKIIAFEMGYSVDSVKVLLDRFENKYKVIKYSEETQEIAILNYLKYSIIKGGKPVIDCIAKDIEQVNDKSLLKIIYQRVMAMTDKRETMDSIRSMLSKYDNDNDNDNDNDSIVPRYVPRIVETVELEPTQAIKKPVKHIFGIYKNVKLTDNEYQKLINEYGLIGDEAIEFLSAYREEKGYKNKSDYLSIRRWVIDALKERSKKESKTSSNPFKDILLKEMENEHQRNRVADGDYQNSISGVLPEPE